jgi:hypothetical protein
LRQRRERDIKEESMGKVQKGTSGILRMVSKETEEEEGLKVEKKEEEEEGLGNMGEIRRKRKENI